MKKILIRASMVKNTFTECLLAVLWILGIKFHRGQFQPRQPFPPQPPISNDFVESGCEQFSTKKLALIIAMLIGLCFSAKAQTNMIPGSTFLDTLKSYVSSSNTNLHTFQKTGEVDIWAGMDYQSGVNFAASLGASKLVYGNFSVEGVVRNAGIAGTILSAQGGFGYSVVFNDLKATAYLDGGYDFLVAKPYAAPGLRILKALTDNTFAGVGIEAPIKFTGTKTLVPVLSITWGVTF